MFHELPSSTILRPKCLLIEKICWVNSCSLGNEAFTHWWLLVGQCKLTWSLSLYFIQLFTTVLCCAVLLLRLSLQPTGEGKHQNKPTPKDSLSPSVRKHTCTLSSLCLSTSYIRPAWAWVFPLSSAFNNASSLCPGPHIRIPQRDAVNFSLYLAHSLSRTPSRLCLTPPFFICRFLINSLSLSLNLHHFSLHLSNWWPHPTPTLQWLHRAAAAFKAAKCWWRGQLTPAAVSGTPGWDCWQETSGRHQPPQCLISLWISIVDSINWRNAHLCCLGSESGTVQGQYQVSTRPPTKCLHILSLFFSHEEEDRVCLWKHSFEIQAGASMGEWYRIQNCNADPRICGKSTIEKKKKKKTWPSAKSK